MSNFPPQGGYPPPGAYPGGGPPPPKKSNTKWILLAGGGCLLVVIIIVGVIAALVGGGFYMLSNSEASIAAQTFVRQNGEVKSEVGEPVTTSFSGGNINIENGIGRADISVSVSGPKGSGTADVKLSQSGNAPWTVTSAAFTNSAGQTTDLK
jgi:hypothetical protein